MKEKTIFPREEKSEVLFDKILSCKEYNAPNNKPLLFTCFSHSFWGLGIFIGVIKARITNDVIILEIILPAPAFLSVILAGSIIPSRMVTDNLKSTKTPITNWHL